MQLPARRPVVPEIRERPRERVQGIRPVRLRAGSVKHHEPDGDLQRTTVRPEAALISHARQQPGQRIITGVPCSAAPVNAVKDQISSSQLVELHHMLVGHQQILSRAAASTVNQENRRHRSYAPQRKHQRRALRQRNGARAARPTECWDGCQGLARSPVVANRSCRRPDRASARSVRRPPLVPLSSPPGVRAVRNIGPTRAACRNRTDDQFITSELTCPASSPSARRKSMPRCPARSAAVSMPDSRRTSHCLQHRRRSGGLG